MAAALPEEEVAEGTSDGGSGGSTCRWQASLSLLSFSVVLVECTVGDLSSVGFWREESGGESACEHSGYLHLQFCFARACLHRELGKFISFFIFVYEIQEVA